MTRLVTASELAAQLSVSTAYVRRHAAELGAVRLHSGPRAPLRFDPDEVMQGVRARRVARPETAKSRQRPGPRRTARGVELLPLPGGGSR